MALEPITRQEQIIAGKDLEPITRMEKFLKQYGGGGGLPTGGAAYQQLVTDGNGKAKWEDRLAYETDPVFTEIVPEETVTFSNNSGNMMAMWPSAFNPVDGSMYTVRIDGAEYTCPCVSFINDNSILTIGNLSIIGAGDDTGEPFIMYKEEGSWAFFYRDSASEHTISIYGYEASVKKIDTKYLPRLNVVISGNDNDGYSSNYTAQEIRSAYYAGKPITGVYIINDRTRILTLKDPSKLDGSFDYYPVVFYEMVDAADEFSYRAEGCYMYKEYKISDGGVTVYKPTSCLILSSSASGSSKKFKITVDDSGAITATEVTS